MSRIAAVIAALVVLGLALPYALASCGGGGPGVANVRTVPRR